MIEVSKLPGAAPRVVTHRGAFHELPSVCDQFGVRRAILVAGGSVEILAAEARRGLGVRCAGRFSHPVPHVPAKEANLAVASAQEIHADGVISIGGGSAVGYGKIIALALRLPLIAVPTTYAGAEMTDRYAVTTERGKETGTSGQVMPRVVLRDPDISVTLPQELTASSGMIAVGHCLESLWHAQPNDRAMRDARTALGLLWSALPRLLRHPHDVRLREQALHAAGLAGAAQHTHGAQLLTVLAEKLGGLYRVDHGALVGCIAPGVLRLQEPQSAAAQLALSEVSGSDAPGWQVLTDFARRLGLPTRLADLGITDDLTTVATSVTAHRDYPGNHSSDDVSRILVSA